MVRRKLPDRRLNTTVKFEHSNGHKYLLTVGLYPDGSPGEIFINTSMKSGSEADLNASDAAVAVSLALQHGCTLDELRLAMKRNPDGTPAGPLGRALDEVAKIIFMES